MKRLFNLTRWRKLKDPVLVLPGEVSRRIVLEINVEQLTHVEVATPDGAVLLGVVQPGRMETFEFHAPEAEVVVSMTSDGEVFYFTNDGVNDVRESAKASLAKLATRAARNPQLELMMLKAETNFQRMLDRQSREFNAAMAARDARNAAAADPDTGEVPDDNGQGGGAASPVVAGEGGGEPGETLVAAAAVGKAGKAKGANSGGTATV